MFKKKKKEPEKKKKSLISVRIKKRDDYAVLEPFDLSYPKKATKTEKVKPKLIIQKNKPKEIKPEKPVQKVLPKPPEKPTKPEKPISKIHLDHIETDIDKLMEIIDEKKVVGLEYLSKTLKISVDRLEIWAKMLEDRGLIEIEYPIIGLPKLRKKEWKKKS